MKILGFLFSVGLLWGGGQGVYTWFTNMDPTELTCSEFLEGKIEKDWLVISDCYVDNSEILVIYNESTGTIDEDNTFYLPIRADKSGKLTTAFLRINSKNSKIIYTNMFNSQDDEKKFNTWFGDHPDQLEFINKADIRELKGLRLFGIDSEDDDREILKKYSVNKDFIILDENKKPQPGLSFTLLVLGLGVLLFLGRGSSKESE